MKKIFPIANLAASACLCGHKVRYDGGDCATADVLVAQVLPICPEVMGGLPTPRAPAEIVGGDGHDVWAGRARVVDANGVDVTGAFKLGAELTLQRLQAAHIDTVYLKAKSPSCGQGQIYDGSFSGQLREGDGVSTALFQQHGIRVISL